MAPSTDAGAQAQFPLRVKSNHSFLEGASHPEELVERAHALGLPALAITDRDGLYGVVRAQVRARELGLPLLLGTELRVRRGDRRLPVVLLAKDRAGYAAMCRLVSAGQAARDKGEARVTAASGREPPRARPSSGSRTRRAS